MSDSAVNDAIKKLEAIVEDDTLETVEDVRARASTIILNLNSTYNRVVDQGFDLYQTHKEVSESDDLNLFDSLEKEHEENDLAQFLVSRLVNRLMDFRLVGDKTEKEEVENFMYLHDTKDHMEQMLIQAFVLGTGMMQRFGEPGELRNLIRLDASTVTQYKSQNQRTGDLVYKYEQTFQTENTDPNSTQDNVTVIPLKANKLAVFRPVQKPHTAYGISYMKGSLLALQAIRQLLMDIPAGIKRLAYGVLVMKIDLAGVTTAAEAKTRIKSALSAFQKFDAATSTIIGIDKNNDLKYVGADGGSVPIIAPVLPIIEPILIPLLQKWHCPLGIFLQTNSNRALIQGQTSEAQREVVKLQSKFARFIEKELIAPILGTPEGEAPKVKVKHNIDIDSALEELQIYIEMYKNGALSREALLERAGIEENEERDLHYFLPNNAIVTTDDVSPEPEEQPEKAPKE